MYESERLARTLFSATSRGELAQTLPLIHPDAVIVPSVDLSTVVSRDDLVQQIEAEPKPRVLDTVAHTYAPCDDQRIIVEGRVRLRLDDGGYLDREMVWAMVFRDRLLYRSWAVTSLEVAEMLLDDTPLEAEELQDP